MSERDERIAEIERKLDHPAWPSHNVTRVDAEWLLAELRSAQRALDGMTAQRDATRKLVELHHDYGLYMAMKKFPASCPVCEKHELFGADGHWAARADAPAGSTESANDANRTAPTTCAKCGGPLVKRTSGAFQDTYYCSSFCHQEA